MSGQNTNRDRPETERVLEIRVRDFDSFAAESAAALDEAVSTRESGPSVLAFETPREALRLFSDARFELLETIRTEDPESIRSLARLVERDVSAVHGDLDLLEEYGIVELRPEGRNKRPSVAYDEIRIELDLSFDSNGKAETAVRS